MMEILENGFPTSKKSCPAPPPKFRKEFAEARLVLVLAAYNIKLLGKFDSTEFHNTLVRVCEQIRIMMISRRLYSCYFLSVIVSVALLCCVSASCSCLSLMLDIGDLQ